MSTPRSMWCPRVSITRNLCVISLLPISTLPVTQVVICVSLPSDRPAAHSSFASCHPIAIPCRAISGLTKEVAALGSISVSAFSVPTLTVVKYRFSVGSGAGSCCCSARPCCRFPASHICSQVISTSSLPHREQNFFASFLQLNRLWPRCLQHQQHVCLSYAVMVMIPLEGDAGGWLRLAI